MEVPRGMEPTGTNGRTRHTLSDPPWGVGSRPVVVFSLDGRERCFLWSRRLVRRFACVRCPVPGPPRPESWLVPLPAAPGWGLAVQSGFAVAMAQARRPVPFRTRKLRPGTAMVLHSRGCGRVARRRILSLDLPVESPWGIPGRSLFFVSHGGSRRASAPGTPIFYALFRCSFPVACGRLPFHDTPASHGLSAGLLLMM